MVNDDQVNRDHVQMVGDKVVRKMGINRALKVGRMDRVISLNMDQTVHVLVDRLLTVQMDAQTLAIKILIDLAN